MDDVKYELEKWKILALLKEGEDKLLMLGKVNQSEDNSSELAGFEINKLLREQAKLEQLYKGLVSSRGGLKGLSNKKKLIKVQRDISDVARSLKENTKKLCRLFKENKNINLDIDKVFGYRSFIRSIWFY
jgi:hypothetical protein